MVRTAVTIWLLVGACAKHKDDACERQVAELRSWLRALASDGAAQYVTRGQQLVVIDEPAAAPQRVPTLTLTPHELTFEGRLLAQGRWTDTAPLEQELAAAAKTSDRLLVASDAAIPWSELAAVEQVARRAGIRRLVLVFAARARVAAPASSLDHELAALALDMPGQPVADLLDTAGVPQRVLSRCPTALALARPRSYGEPDYEASLTAFTERLPDALRACDCKLDAAAVRRLAWSYWARDVAGSLQTTITIEVASDGAAIAIPANTPWSTAHARVVAARDRPLRFEVAR